MPRHPALLHVGFLAAPLAALLLVVTWPSVAYLERETTQVASVFYGQNDGLARLAGSMGDVAMDAAVVGGPIVGRPILDAVRSALEPQSNAALKMIGVPSNNLSSGPGTSGGLFPVRKLLEGIVMAIMIPALLINLTINMIQKGMSFRDAALSSVRPWALAVFALLAYPLLDIAAYWGVGRPLAQQLGSTSVKYGVIKGIMNSGMADTGFVKWANDKMVATAGTPEAAQANAGGGISAGMSLTMTCAKAISTAETLESLLEPTTSKTPYELRECRKGSAPVEARLIMMRNIMSMAPVLEGEATNGQQAIAELGVIIKTDPEVVFAMFDSIPDKAALLGRLQASTDPDVTSAVGRWFKAAGNSIAAFFSALMNPGRLLAEMIEKTVAGIFAAIVSIIVTIAVLLVSFEAEMARAFSLALAPIAIGWALFPRGQSKLAAWAEGHVATAFRVAGAELLGLVLMALVLGVALLPMRRFGAFGVVFVGFTTLFSLIVLFGVYRSMAKAMAGDITEASIEMAKGTMNAVKTVTITAAAAVMTGGAAAGVAGTLSKSAAGRAVVTRVASAGRRATALSARIKKGGAAVGQPDGGPLSSIANTLHNVGAATRGALEKVNESARRDASSAADAAKIPNASAANDVSRDRSSNLMHDPHLRNVSIRIEDATVVGGDGHPIEVSTVDHALSRGARDAILAQAERDGTSSRIAEGFRHSTAEEKQAAQSMLATIRQALLAESALGGGTRAGLDGRFGINEKGNRTFQGNEESVEMMARGIRAGGKALESQFRADAFAAGMLTAQDTDVSLEDVLRQSAGAQVAAAIVADRDLQKKAEQAEMIIALRESGIADPDSALGAALRQSGALLRGEDEKKEEFSARVGKIVTTRGRALRALQEARRAGVEIEDETLHVQSGDRALDPTAELTSGGRNTPELFAATQADLRRVESVLRAAEDRLALREMAPAREKDRIHLSPPFSGSVDSTNILEVQAGIHAMLPHVTEAIDSGGFSDFPEIQEALEDVRDKLAREVNKAAEAAGVALEVYAASLPTPAFDSTPLGLTGRTPVEKADMIAGLGRALGMAAGGPAHPLRASAGALAREVSRAVAEERA